MHSVAHRLSAALIVIAVAFGMAACTRDAPPPAPKPPSAATQAFIAEHARWRQEADAQARDPEGYLSLIGLHWIEEGAHYIGASPRNGIRLSMGPDHVGMVERRGKRLRFVPERGVAMMLDGHPLTRGTTLRDDRAADGPSEVRFDDGKASLMVIRRGDRYALRVRHADAPALKGYTGLKFWPADPAWRVQARFVAHPPGTTLPIANIVGITEAMPNPGRLEFWAKGKPLRVEAIDGGDHLFLMVADRTSGHASYGAGRYLEVAKPDAQGRTWIDFNRATNPPCAYTAFATCPLPPNENRLDIPIEAGEKSYKPRAARA